MGKIGSEGRKSKQAVVAIQTDPPLYSIIVIQVEAGKSPAVASATAPLVHIYTGVAHLECEVRGEGRYDGNYEGAGISGNPGNRQTCRGCSPPTTNKSKRPGSSGGSQIGERGHASDALSPKGPSRRIERRKYQRYRRWSYSVLHYTTSQVLCDSGLEKIMMGWRL